MNTVSIRSASLLAGFSLALMAVIAPLGVMVALPSGATGVAAIVVLFVSALDVLIAVALYPVLRQAGTLLAGCACALRLAYGVVFATAAGFLVSTPDVERFQAIWDAGLFIFGTHLLLVGIAVVRISDMPTWMGMLVAIAGLGYLIDAVSVALNPATSISIGEFAFIGEVILLIWLLGWGGRTTSSETAQGRISPRSTVKA